MTSASSDQRFLIIRPSALGDVCRSVALLASLRRAHPEAVIDWVVQDSFAPAIEHHPDLSSAIYFPRKYFAKWMCDCRAARDLFRWVRKLRRTSYDVVIDAQGLSRSGLVTRATGAPIRIGHNDAREFAWLAYTHRVHTSGGAGHEGTESSSGWNGPGARKHASEPTTQNAERRTQNSPLHTVDRTLTLLKPVGVEPVRDMRLYVPPEALAWWDAELDQRDMLGERYAVFAPTARWPSKRWPIERWPDLVRPLLMRGFDRIIILGAPGEEEQARPLTKLAASTDDDDVAADSPVFNFVGKTTLAQTMAVIARASLVIANDSAPLHIGVGFDRPCVGLFGPTDPAIVGPYGQTHAAIRAFRPEPGEIINYRDPKLGDRLMRVLSSAAVIQHIDRVLARGGVETGSAADTGRAIEQQQKERERVSTIHGPASEAIGEQSVMNDGDRS